MDGTHIFLDSAFFHHFQNQVLSESWKCDFPADILLDNFNRDCELYKNDTIFKQRRKKIIPWIDNPHQWNKVILETCREIAFHTPNIHSKVLEDLHVLEALKDFVEHLHYFYTVASTMSLQDYSFQPLSQYSSNIHDIDKLDPIMLLGYSERFEDNASTSVWDLCVDRHVHVNPHHQVHAIWRNPSEEDVKLYNVSNSTRKPHKKDGFSFKYCNKDFTETENDLSWKYLSKVSTSCGHRTNDDNAWKHRMKERTALKRYYKNTVHCIEDNSAWTLSNGDEMACKHPDDVDPYLVEDSNLVIPCSESRDCNKVAFDLRHFKRDGSDLRHFRVDALREMVCDKVSRRLQKTLKGVVSCEMWDVEIAFFDGLPDEWMKKAGAMMKSLKQSTLNANL